LDLLIRNASEVVTCSGSLSGPAEEALKPLPRGVVGVRGKRIAFLGLETDLPSGAVTAATTQIDAAGGFVGPGFVDAHTHLCFAGERSAEFEQRCQGASYQEIARSGGGIQSTVRETRDASEETLVEAALARLARLLAFGVTTAEVKSGYGLSLEHELKLLRAVRRLTSLQPVELIPTLLCAHAVPTEFSSQRERYVDLCVEEILPAVCEEGLARFCDAFVEEGAFSVPEARRLLSAAQARGLGLRVHADQLSRSGGTQLAIELGAASADHLEQLEDPEADGLARAGVVATLVPTSTLFLRLPRYAPGRVLSRAGVTLALGTNVNPGSAMSENHALALGLACLGNGLTPAEAYLAATRGGALSLQLPEAGRLVVGGPADIVVFACPSFRQLPYHLGMNQVRALVKSGRQVAPRG
jgi:imidazolonepropionase